MEGIFPGDRILLFESVQQGTMKWINCSIGPGVNVYIPDLHVCVINKIKNMFIS